MAIPDFQTIMLPLLQITSDGREHSFREVIVPLADYFTLAQAERDELLPSGVHAKFDNRVNWATWHLKRGGLLEATRRAHFRITPRGEEVLRTNPTKIDRKLLERVSESGVAHGGRTAVTEPEKSELVSTIEAETPEEAIESAYQRLGAELATELLEQIMGCSPAFFERLVIDLLLRMGYGGTRRDAGEAVGRSGDGGIDGIIKEDRLGLDVIYIQAKRWDGVVGRPEIQKFVGALQGQRARKGIFITTSSFTKEATQYVGMIDTKVVLIDGDSLAQLMIDHGVGVAPMATYELKRIDSDYFTTG